MPTTESGPPFDESESLIERKASVGIVKDTLLFIRNCFGFLKNGRLFAGMLFLAFSITLITNGFRDPSQPDGLLVAKLRIRTLNDISFSLAELHHELNPDQRARTSTLRGLRLVSNSVKNRYHSANIGRYGIDDPRPILEAAINILDTEDISDSDAIFGAMKILEGFFSAYRGRKEMNFDVRPENLSTGDRAKISTALDDFNQYVKNNHLGNLNAKELKELSATELRELCEMACDYARRVSYTLFPYWGEYTSNAPEYDMKKIALFKSCLDKELLFTQELAERFEEEKHFQEVVDSVQRRLDTLESLESGDTEKLKAVLNKALSQSVWYNVVAKE